MMWPMATTFTLASVDAETWGEKLGRVHRRSKKSFQEVAELLYEALGLRVDPSTLSRLQNEEEVPDGGPRRTTAAAYIIALGYNPEDFGLGADALPPMVDVNRMKELIAAARSRCTARGSRPPMVGARVDLDYLLPATVPA